MGSEKILLSFWVTSHDESTANHQHIYKKESKVIILESFWRWVRPRRTPTMKAFIQGHLQGVTIDVYDPVDLIL